MATLSRGARRALASTADLTYSSYLQLDDLLELQRSLSRPECHDEMQFIIVHQVFELWFKLALHEIDAIFVHLEGGRTIEATRLFKRAEAILRCFLPTLEVLETMVPSDFLEFRELLKPASGFQSVQFRELEFACGVRDGRYLKLFETKPEALRRLQDRLARPSLWDAFVDHLRNRGYDVRSEATQEAAIVAIYRDPAANDLMMLCEAMIEFDEIFQLYREHHVRMAERMIGHKPGTGQKAVDYSLGRAGPMGTQGVEYLRSTTQKRFFPLLWSARTAM